MRVCVVLFPCTFCLFGCACDVSVMLARVCAVSVCVYMIVGVCVVLVCVCLYVRVCGFFLVFVRAY